MKIVSFDREPLSEADSFGRVDLFPDAALLRAGKPFFVPSIAPHWAYWLSVAVRVGRLGKNVGERFAERYIDAVALAVVTRPLNVDAGMMPGLYNTYEGAVAIGSWLPVPTPLAVEVNNGQAFDLTSELVAARKLFALSSRGVMMKMGDILTTCRIPLGVDLPIDSVVEASVGGELALRMRVK